MLTLIQIELYKIFKKWRTYISFITVAILVTLIESVMLYNGKHYLEFLTQNIRNTFVFEGNFLNGYLMSHLVLSALTIHIPFLVTLVAGDLLAGEATSGTYRMLLTRPISRFKLITAKFVTGIIYTNLLIMFLAIMSLGLGVVLFGTGELIVIKSEIYIFAKTDIIWRFVIAYGFASLSMSVVASLAFLFSSLVENSIGPIISTMAVIIIFLIVSSLDLDLFNKIQPYLFTTYMNSWRSAFTSPVDMDSFYKSGSILLAHIIGFYSLTLYLFIKRDILS